MGWNKISLIGVGLLGGSLGLALRQTKLAGHVAAYVRRESACGEVLACGAADSATTDLTQAVSGSDLVVFCTPLGQMSALMKKTAPHLVRGTIITDVGSVKNSVHAAIDPIAREFGLVFVGGHPMAGSEKIGVSAAKADLFEKALCILTPGPTSTPEALRRLTSLWKSLGSRPITLNPDLHDQLVSRSSHLPHLMASALADYVLDQTHGPEQTTLCATGFRDTTRVSSGSPEMWRDIAMANRTHLSKSLSGLMDSLSKLKAALDAGDEKFLEEHYLQAKNRRDEWLAQFTTGSTD